MPSLREPEPRHPYARDETLDSAQAQDAVRLGVDELLDLRRESILESGTAHIISMKVAQMETLPFLQIHLLVAGGECSFVTTQIRDHSVIDCPPGEYQGMLLYEGTPYLFYLEEDEEREIAPRVVMKTGEYQWATMAEVLNQKSVYGVPVSSDVVRFFERNKQACFIVNDDLNAVETPSVVYNGSYSGGITCAINLGKARAGPYAKYGSFYYFGDYSLALRYACFTVDMKPRIVTGRKITRGTSAVLEQGGVAKYVLREGAVRIVWPEEEVGDAWAEEHDCLAEPGKHLDCLYVAKLYEQQKILSYAVIDTKNVKRTGKSTVGARIV